MPQDIRRLVRDQMDRMAWTPYRLAKATEDAVTTPTIYNFLNGAPVKSDTLAAIMEAVGLVVVPVATATMIPANAADARRAAKAIMTKAEQQQEAR